MEIKTIINWLRGQTLAIKIVAIVATILVTVILLFTSCSASTRAMLPDVSANKFGAEGIVSKEKNVTKQTKWYFKPPVENVEPIIVE